MNILNFASVIVTLLSISSIIGLYLKLKKPQSNSIKNYIARVNSWWIMCGLIALSFYLGKTSVIVFFAILSFMSLREFISISKPKASDYWALFLAFYLIIPLHYYLLYIDWYNLYTIFIPVWMFFALSAICALSQDTNEFLIRNSKIQYAVMVCIYGISHVPAFFFLQNSYINPTNLMLFFIFTVQISDVLQYAFGKLFGKRPIAPKLSPNKTIEGFVGGSISAVLLSSTLYSLTPFTFLHTLFFSSVIVLSGFFGGLILSAVKRSLGAKDWGETISGHGGFMDRLDSIAFSAPVFFHAVRYFYS